MCCRTNLFIKGKRNVKETSWTNDSALPTKINQSDTALDLPYGFNVLVESRMRTPTRSQKGAMHCALGRSCPAFNLCLCPTLSTAALKPPRLNFVAGQCIGAFFVRCLQSWWKRGRDKVSDKERHSCLPPDRFGCLPADMSGHSHTQTAIGNSTLEIPTVCWCICIVVGLIGCSNRKTALSNTEPFLTIYCLRVNYLALALLRIIKSFTDDLYIHFRQE